MGSVSSVAGVLCVSLASEASEKKGGLGRMVLLPWPLPKLLICNYIMVLTSVLFE